MSPTFGWFGGGLAENDRFEIDGKYYNFICAAIDDKSHSTLALYIH